MATVPYPPFDDRAINPYGKIGNGTNYGICDPKGVSFAHSMVGYLSSTDAWFRRRDVASLTPWGIGGSADGKLDGKIFRWMDYHAFRDVQPWSSGPWNAPGYGDGAAYVKKYGVAGINGYGQAIELSDGGKIATSVSLKQWISFIWLSAAIAHDDGVTSLNYRDILAFMHHREITGPSYKDCPFPRVYNFTNEYINAIVTLMAFFEGRVTDINKLVFKIANHTIDLRFIGEMKGGAVPKPTTPTGPIFVDFTPNRTFTVGRGGATVRQYAGRESRIYTDQGRGGTLPPGTKVVVDGYYHGEAVNGDDRWLVQANDPRGRIHISGFIERI